MTNADIGTISGMKKKLRRGKNDLATLFPDLAAQADGSWDPKAFLPSSSVRVGWICSKNAIHRWSAPIGPRVRGTGCPLCCSRIIVAGMNDLATTNPTLAAQGDGSWDPTRFVGGSHTKVTWICTVDPRHRYLCSVNERSRGVGCSVCSGRVVMSGINDLRTLDPELAAECDGTWDPSKFARFSNTKVGWVCRNNPNHRWEAQVSNRSNGNGCPGCSISGYDVTADGWLYLITDHDRGLTQIGISNYPKQRLSHHTRSGWETLDILGPLDGDLCYEWEQSIIRHVRASGIDEPIEAGRFEGFTEAWMTAELPVTTIGELRELVHQAESIPA